jgi:hypothetical protein
VDSTDMGDAERLSDLSVEVGVEGDHGGHDVEERFVKVLRERERRLMLMRSTKCRSSRW